MKMTLTLLCYNELQNLRFLKVLRAKLLGG